MKIKQAFLYFYCYTLISFVLIQSMEQDNNLLYYFKNINHPLIQTLKKTDTHALQQIINSGNFNPNVQLYKDLENKTYL